MKSEGDVTKLVKERATLQESSQPLESKLFVSSDIGLEVPTSILGGYPDILAPYKFEKLNLYLHKDAEQLTQFETACFKSYTEVKHIYSRFRQVSNLISTGLDEAHDL